MKAIVVAGGRGERLRPLTDTKPKPMVDVAGKPILLHTLEHLKYHGVREFIFALCYLPQVITDFFGDGSKFGVSIEYTFEDPQNPLGTAGAIKPAQKHISETCIITYADILRELDITAMMHQHIQTKAFSTLHVYKRTGANPKSMITFQKDLRILDFIERPSPDQIEESFVWANGSFYIGEPELFSFIPDSVTTDFGKDIFPALLKAKKEVYAFPTESYFIDIGTKEKLAQAEQHYTR